MFMRYGREEKINKEVIFNSSQKVDLNDLMKKVRNQEKKAKEQVFIYLLQQFLHLQFLV